MGVDSIKHLQYKKSETYLHKKRTVQWHEPVHQEIEIFPLSCLSGLCHLKKTNFRYQPDAQSFFFELENMCDSVTSKILPYFDTIVVKAETTVAAPEEKFAEKLTITVDFR